MIYGYLNILLTILLSVYGQLVLKWQMPDSSVMPELFFDKILFLLKLFLNPWIFSSVVAAFLASLTWMAALTKFELSYAYPFMSLSFVFVLIFGILLLGESMNVAKVSGVALIFIGLVIGSRG